MKLTSKFQRGSSTYTCESCKKLTRDTGCGERACRLCVDCYDLAGIDNALSDNGPEEAFADYGNEICGILNRRPELAPHFPELAKLVGDKATTEKGARS